MAPKRPPEANLITSDFETTRGVLICRAEGTQARDMAVKTLEIDTGLTHDEAVSRIASALVTPGRWFKTPDRNGIHSWILVSTGSRPRAGATPGVYYSWND